MRPTLRVHVNRDQPRSVEPEESAIDVDGPFDLVLDNHGQPAHVHVHTDDALAGVTDVEDTNWFVADGDSETVPVSVRSIEAVDGRLEVATAYGAERAQVDVHVAAGSGGVEVDEELGKIQVEKEPVSNDTETYIIAGAFVFLGVAAAVAVGTLVEDPSAVMVGLFVVALAVGASLYMLLRS